MSTPLNYVGVPPPASALSSDATICTTASAVSMFNGVDVSPGYAVTATQVNEWLAAQTPSLIPSISTVTTELTSGKLTATSLNSQYASYLNASQLDVRQVGSTYGVAELKNGIVDASQVPSTVIDNRIASYGIMTTPAYWSGLAAGDGAISGPVTSSTVYGVMTMGASPVTVSTSGLRLGWLQITDPGYPYTVMPFAWVQGAGVVMSGTRVTNPPGGYWPDQTTGTGMSGYVKILDDASSAIYGYGWLADSYYGSLYPVLPTTTEGTSPGPGLRGTLKLDLMGYADGSSYTFFPYNMVFFAVVLPVWGPAPS